MANKDLIINSDIDLDQKVLGLLICTAQEQTAKMMRSIRHMNLSLTQVNILHALSNSPSGQLTVNQIKSFMVDESPNVSRSLNKLMENGYIVKERSNEDQRVVYITVTDKGREIHESADKELLKLSLNLSQGELEKMYELLTKI
ncbi:MarR family transcriptional regulator [Anaeromicrobium sediminis]|uniref:MarR family transcriptional regulator n=2 Tax=Anaeromicrobium sediminis TaxID=1478221 RepID=A0A267MFH4_9FIRM|nr:MarR family transcriptional regulator [Anaeromicrobium sediminis]